jgi:hypothetical protein
MLLQAVVFPLVLLCSSVSAAPYASASGAPQEHDSTVVRTQTKDVQCRTIYGRGPSRNDVPTSTSTKHIENPAVTRISRYTVSVSTITKDSTVFTTETAWTTKTVPAKKVGSLVTSNVQDTTTSTRNEVETSTEWVQVTRLPPGMNKRDSVPVSVNCKQVEAVQTTYIDIKTAKAYKTTVSGTTETITKTVNSVTVETSGTATIYRTTYVTTGSVSVAVFTMPLANNHDSTMTIIVPGTTSTATVTSTKYVGYVSTPPNPGPSPHAPGLDVSQPASSVAAASSITPTPPVVTNPWPETTPGGGVSSQPAPSAAPSQSALPPSPGIPSDARPDTCPYDKWHIWHCDYLYNIPICMCLDLGGPPSIPRSSSVAPAPLSSSSWVPSPPAPLPPSPPSTTRPDSCPASYWICLYPYGIEVCFCTAPQDDTPEPQPLAPDARPDSCPNTDQYYWYCTVPCMCNKRSTSILQATDYNLTR